jgi:hypothetical protein
VGLVGITMRYRDVFASAGRCRTVFKALFSDDNVVAVFCGVNRYYGEEKFTISSENFSEFVSSKI